MIRSWPAFAFLLVTGFALADPATVRLCHDDGDPVPDIDNPLNNAAAAPQKILNIVALQMASRKTGIKLEIIPTPWKRCLSEIQKGSMDGAFAATYRADRAEYARFPMRDGKVDERRAMQYDSYTLYRQRGTHVTWEDGHFHNLAGPVGVQPGHSITEIVRAAGAKTDDSAKSATDNLKKVAAGRLPAAALATIKADHALSLDIDLALRVEKDAKPMAESYKYLMFSKKFSADHPEIPEKLWNSLVAVRGTSEYKTIEKTVLGKPESMTSGPR